MKVWIRSKTDSTVSLAEIIGDSVTVGSSADNDIVLKNPTVAREALIMRRLDSTTWKLRKVGKSSVQEICRLDDSTEEKRIEVGGEPFLARHGTRIELFPYILDFDGEPKSEVTPTSTQAAIDAEVRALDDLTSTLIREVHSEVLSRLDINADDREERDNPSRILELEHHIDQLTSRILSSSDQSQALIDHIAGSNLRQGVLDHLIEQAGNKRVNKSLRVEEAWSQFFSDDPEQRGQRQQLIQSLAAQFTGSNVDRVDPGGDKAESQLRLHLRKVDTSFWPTWRKVTDRVAESMRSYLAMRELKKQLKDILFGYGPLEDLLRLPTVTEIMVVSSDKIYVERNGVLENCGRRFVSDEVTLTVIERIVSTVNRRIDKSQPLVDARLKDGSRVNAIVPPLAVSGPCLTIRRFPKRLTIQELIQLGSISEPAVRFLRASVLARKNIVISGGTGTGKTTFLNCLSSFFPINDRIVTVEDTSELKIRQKHVVTLETKDKNAENEGAYEIRDLVKNTLRMRPDRIVVGECRGAEAVDMLQAMNTGHDGSLTTLHANSPEDAMLRLETLAGMSGELPIDSIRRQIASAVDLVVQIKREKKRRFVSTISEVIDFDADKGQVRVKHLFELPPFGESLALLPTGRLPTFIEKLTEQNLLDLDVFFSTGKEPFDDAA